MPSTTYNNIVDTNTEWNTGTLVNTATRGDALQVDNTPVIYRHDFDTMSTWTNYSPASGTFSIVPGVGKYGTVGQASGKCWMVNDSVNFPYDPAKLYEVSGRVRQVTQGASDVRLYIGITGVASDGVTLINENGDDVHSSEHYFATSAYYLQPGEEWKTFRGYFTGHGTVNNSGGQNDPVNPGEMYTGVAFIRPMFIMNYDRNDGVTEIAYIQIREVSAPVNHALNKDVWAEHKSDGGTRVKELITNGNRDTLEYYSAFNSGPIPAHVTVDLGSPLPISQIGIWHFYNDTRQYNSVYTEVSSGEPLLFRTPTPLSDYSVWTIGTSGSQGPYNDNGVAVENAIIEDTDPFGVPTAIWECRPDSGGNASGGWQQLFACDPSKTYRLSVFVRKRVNLADGSTYLGCENTDQTQNLSGSVNGNPYFWSGDLPSLDEWYLMVGVIHPSGYSGGDTGVSGVYNMSGSRVIDGTEFRMSPGATQQEMRAYLYYADLTTTRQDFVYPRVDVMDGTEPDLKDLTKAMKYMPVYNGPEHGTYTESSKGWWVGLETSYVRYIRDRVAGNTLNTGDHWVEIEAYGEPEVYDTGTRTDDVTLGDAGLITSTSIDWSDRPALMTSTGSFVYIPYSTNMNITTDELTIEAEVCWMGPFNNDGDFRSTIFTNPRTYYTQILDNGKLSMYTYPDGGTSNYMNSVSSLEIGRWYHVAFTEDTSGYRKIYIDGVLDNGEQHEVGIRSMTGAERPAGIGSETVSSTRVGNMAVRNVRLWDYARTEATIASEMYDRLVGNETGLLCYWPMDDGTGNVATNLVAGGNDGNITNARWITYQVETNVSLDSGSTWQGWKTVNKGDSIPDIPLDADGRKVVVSCRQTLDGTNCEAPAQMDSLTITADGRITVTKKWNGSQWIDTPIQRWDGSQWVSGETRVYTDRGWL